MMQNNGNKSENQKVDENSPQEQDYEQSREQIAEAVEPMIPQLQNRLSAVIQEHLEQSSTKQTEQSQNAPGDNGSDATRQEYDTGSASETPDSRTSEPDQADQRDQSDDSAKQESDTQGSDEESLFDKLIPDVVQNAMPEDWEDQAEEWEDAVDGQFDEWETSVERHFTRMFIEAFDSIFSERNRQNLLNQARTEARSQLHSALQSVEDSATRQGLEEELRPPLDAMVTAGVNAMFTGSTRNKFRRDVRRASRCLASGDLNGALREIKDAVAMIFGQIKPEFKRYSEDLFKALLKATAAYLQQSVKQRGEELRDELLENTRELRESLGVEAEGLQTKFGQTGTSGAGRRTNRRSGPGWPPAVKRKASGKSQQGTRTGWPPGKGAPSGRPPFGWPPSAPPPEQVTGASNSGR